MTVQYCKEGGIFIFTAQMVSLADQNGKTYECEYGTYSKENGFQIKNFGVSNDFEDMLYDLFHKDMWSLKVEPKVMTKEEIEKALGYKIKIKNENINKINKSNDIDIHRIPRLLADDDIFSFIFK